MRKRIPEGSGFEPNEEYQRRKAERFSVPFTDEMHAAIQNEEFVDWLYDWIRKPVSSGVVELPTYDQYATLALVDLCGIARDAEDYRQRRALLRLASAIANGLADAPKDGPTAPWVVNHNQEPAMDLLKMPDEPLPIGNVLELLGKIDLLTDYTKAMSGRGQSAETIEPWIKQHQLPLVYLPNSGLFRIVKKTSADEALIDKIDSELKRTGLHGYEVAWITSPESQAGFVFLIDLVKAPTRYQGVTGRIDPARLLRVLAKLNDWPESDGKTITEVRDIADLKAVLEVTE